ncbi:MAG: sodium:calcium antiporter [Alphaproteobacteria bacterium]
MDFLTLPWLIALLAGSALVIGAAGTRLVRIADRLADVTGIGEAITGAVLLGALTSLSGVVTSVTAAWEGFPQLAISNAIGGIAAQTAFLAVADMVYRRANLEHAAASLTNVLNGCLLLAFLSLILFAALTPPVAVWAVHPLTPLLFVLYVLGVRMTSEAQRHPMWGPEQTADTKVDVPDEPRGGAASVARLALAALVLGLIVSAAGWLVGRAGIELVTRADMSEGVVGMLITAVATSVPELVTTIAAVRRGALTLAVGGILGGNTFDVLFAAFSDIAYREGSIYHAMSGEEFYIGLLTILMTAVLVLGLLQRERHGFANIGFESVLLIVLYAGGALILVQGPASFQ